METPEKLFSVKHKVILITGGAGFLGMEYALILSRAGARVVIFDAAPVEILKKKTAEIKRRTGLLPVARSVDITDQAEVHRAVREVLKRWGRIDVLINNAALTYAPAQSQSKAQFSPYEKYPLDLWQRAIDIGMTGSLIMAQAVIPAMKRARSGVIINVGSIYGITAFDNRLYGKGEYGSIAYAATKGAVPNFTRAIASYLAPFGIRVNTLTPGGTFNHQPNQFVKKYSSRTMLGRMAERDEFNGAILFLVSEASRYMTGANLIIDGGWSAW